MSFMERLQSAMILKTSLHHPLEAHIIEHPHRSFLQAIQTGQNDSVIDMILGGFDVDHSEGSHTPPLIHAVMNERAQIVQTLLLYGAEPNIQDHHAETPLHFAVKMRMNETIHLLVRYGADITKSNGSGITPLQVAEQQNSKTVLKILISTPPIQQEKITLFEAAGSGNLHAIVSADTAPDRLFWKNKKIQSLLHLAVHGNNLRLICYLLNKGLDIDAADRNGDTPLTFAAKMSERLDILAFLLKRHATIDHKNNIGNSALTLALANGYFEYVYLLLKNGANIHTYDGIQTPLTLTHHAIEKFHDDATQFRDIEAKLLIKGAHVDIPTNRLNWTPLIHTSTRQQDPAMRKQMDLLLHLGADVNYTDTNGRTALMLACSTGRNSAVKKLLEYYADTDHLDNFGWSALMFAVYYNHHQIARTLLEKGADVNTTSNRGLNALKIAMQHERKLLIDLLLDYGAIAEDENRD